MLKRPRVSSVLLVFSFLLTFITTLFAQTPAVNSISPTHGYAGDQITIIGSHFGVTQAPNGLVLIGSTWGTVVSWSSYGK